MANERIFAQHVLRGKRFERGFIPVEVLPEIAEYRELIIDVAKALFLRRFPGRARVPRGFVARFTLGFTSIEQGCVIVPIKREAPSQMSLLPDVFDEARDLVNKTIEDIDRGLPLLPQFPKHLLLRFGSFGRYLRDDESLELRAGTASKGPRYTTAVRNKLITLAPKERQPINICGKIRAVDRGALTFAVQTSIGRIDGRYEPTLETDILDAFGEYGDPATYTISGIGRHDANGELKYIEQVFELQRVDEHVLAGPDIDSRMADLAKIEAGWYCGAGDPLDPEGLAWASDLLKRVVNEVGIPQPYIYPTPDGEIHAEWTFGTWEVGLILGLGQRNAIAIAVNTDGGASEDVEEAAPDTAASIVEFLAKYSQQGGSSDA